MSITVELTYDMSKALGLQRLEMASVGTVKDVVEVVRARFAEAGERFEERAHPVAVAVNGVLVNHMRGMKTRVSDGDTVAFVRAAAGG
jgi:molybdopterin converting factor small subunit